VAWDEDQLKELPTVLEDNWLAGDTEAVLLSREELREVAGPGLSEDALGAVLCPREAVVEPWLVPIGYAESALLHGCELRLGTAAVGASFDNQVWTINTQRSEAAAVGRSVDGLLLTEATEPPAPNGPIDQVRARVVVNCAGLYGDSVEQFRQSSGHAVTGAATHEVAATPVQPLEPLMAKKSHLATQSTAGLMSAEDMDDPWFTVTARKGQFVVFQAPMTAVLPSHIIEPVATPFTKGVIVWVTVHGNVVVGPTAVNQLSKTDRSTDPETVAMLQAWAERVVPALSGATVLGTYSGLRPS
jgi:glycerol-3-phosphate dehydrogenase